MSTAQLFDVAAALILVLFGLIGFVKGFISSVMSFIGLACGTYFAWRSSSAATTLFLEFFPNVDESIASIIAMAIVFFCIAIAISLVSKLLCFLIKFVQLSGVNRLAGLLIGLLTGVAVIVAVYGGITQLAPELGRGWINYSIFMSLAEKIWPYVFNFFMSHGLYDPLRLVPKTIV